MPRARPQRFSSALVPFVLAYARQKGLDAEGLAKRHLWGKAAPPGPAPVTVAAFRALLEEVARRLEDPLLGLHLAQALPRGAYGLLEFAARSAPTGRAALEHLARYGALINPAARFWLEPCGEDLAIHHRLPDDPLGVGEQGNLFTVARLLYVARELMGDDLCPGQVWFAHEATGLPPPLALFLGAKDVAFGRPSNGFTLTGAALDRPLPEADPALNDVLQAHAARLLGELEPEGLHERTRRAILARLQGGEVTVAQVARALHLGERTLQRRLQEEGISFGSLVEELRARTARELLCDPGLPLKEVARRLGYRDPGAFGRAFKRWTGRTPAAFREAATG